MPLIPAGLGSPQPRDPGGCWFLSMAPQACGPYPSPHLGPDLFGHRSCSLAAGDNSRFPAGLTSCTPLPRFPGPGPSCLEGTGFWQRPALFLLCLPLEPGLQPCPGPQLEVSRPWFCALTRDPVPAGTLVPPPGVHTGAYLDCRCSSCT